MPEAKLGQAVAQDQAPTSEELLEQLRGDLKAGRDWFDALLDVVGLWAEPQETRQDRQFVYFIGGEAFDWLLLAERIFLDLDGLIPEPDKERLLVTGQVAGGLDEANFRSMLGVDKYRGYLNYFYGITVEEALQVTVEQEVFKRYTSNGVRSRGDYTDEAFERIYGAPGDELLAKFRCELGREKSAEMTLTESKEFTYWLFKYRVHRSDNSRVASDTKKGLEQLQGMKPYE